MKYSVERREAILAKLQAPYNRTVNDLAAEEGTGGSFVKPVVRIVAGPYPQPTALTRSTSSIN